MSKIRLMELNVETQKTSEPIFLRERKFARGI